MSYIASDIMDSSRIYLNDVRASFYTNDILLPYLTEVNKELERKLAIYDQPTTRVVTTGPISVAAGITAIGSQTVGFPVDFLIPNGVWERAPGQSEQDWVELTPSYYEPMNATPSTSFGKYAFRNNKINFPPCKSDREVQIRYNRQLVPIVSENSIVDADILQLWMSARLAEMAARYIGMNSDFADEIAMREVGPKEDDLERLLILTDQHNRGRRRRFRTQASSSPR